MPLECFNHSQASNITTILSKVVKHSTYVYSLSTPGDIHAYGHIYIEQGDWRKSFLRFFSTTWALTWFGRSVLDKVILKKRLFMKVTYQ